MKHADKIELIEIEKLIPYARNSRTHSDEQVAQIAGSIREFGFTNPVLINKDGTIVAGHGRVMAARKLGMESVPCLRLGHLTESQVRAYVIADNKLALNAGWDEEMLKAELDTLKDNGFDLNLTGFTDGEIDKLLGAAEVAPTEKTGIDYQEKYAVLIECDDEAHQQSIFDKLQSMGLTCKVLVN
jgi:ParB-like chromosome segregation protein Spo0J